MSWYLLQITPTRESAAIRLLEEQGHEIYCPMTHGDRRKAKAPHAIPLFPGYLFIHLTPGVDNFNPIKTTKYCNFVTFGMNGEEYSYAIASQDLIDALKQWEDDMGLRDLGLEYVAGDRVRVVSGPYQDYLGEVMDISNTDHLILVYLEGRAKGKFRRSEIEPVG